MWAPRQSPNGIFMTLHERDGTAVRVSYIKGADVSVHTCCGNNCVIVFVPIVREYLRGLRGHDRLPVCEPHSVLRYLMDWYVGDEVVFS